MSTPSIKIEPASLARLDMIARDAGAAILQYYGDDAQTTSKSDGSPLTLADTAAEAVILNALRDWDPGVPVISEETEAAPYDERRHWQSFWLVDPLDGTKEFLNRNGEFTVNIALVHNGEPVVGVVYAPALDLMYTGGKGLGSWKTGNGQPRRRVSHEASSNGPFVVIESRSHGSPELEDYLSTIDVAQRIQLGSSLKFCTIAEGAADLYPRLGPTMEWDVAAGDCIYRNASIHGEHASPLTYNKPDLRNGPFVIGKN